LFYFIRKVTDFSDIYKKRQSLNENITLTTICIARPWLA